MNIKILTFLKKKEPYLYLVRYLLGLTMLPYGIAKILKVQFVLSAYLASQPTTLEALSGAQLAWFFLGYSTWFSVLIGILELMPALLLLFRRTALLGAVLMIPITLNVWLINYAFELWPSTKLIASIVLLLNLILLALEWSRIKQILSILIAKGKWFKLRGVELIINVVLIAVVSYLIIKPIVGYKNETTDLIGDWENQHPIVWTLQSEQQNNVILTYREVKIYFNVGGMLNIMSANGEESPIAYVVNPKEKTIVFKYENERVENCKYLLLGDKGLKIIKHIDQVKSKQITQIFEKRVISLNRKTY